MLIESITLAQRDNKELEALIYRFRPLIRKCGRQLHIEDGEQEMVVAFIELIKRFRPERLRSQDDGKVVQYIKNAMNYSCFKIYKKHHNPIATIISLEEITVKEEQPCARCWAVSPNHWPYWNKIFLPQNGLSKDTDLLHPTHERPP